MNNSVDTNWVQYTYIPHRDGKPAKYRNDPDIGGFTDMHTLEVFYEKIAATPQIVTKKDNVELWAPCTFIARRRKSDVIAIHGMVYDIDSGLEFDAHKEFSQFDYIAHTSWSHSEKLHKWRLILPLKRSIPCDEWKFAWAAGSEKFKLYTGSAADHACKDASRAYHVAGCTKQNKHLYQSVINKTGRRFALTYIKTPPPAKMKPRKYKTFNVEEFDNYHKAAPSPKEREEIAHRIGAQIIDGTARKGTCPRCSKKSIWFYIDVCGPNYIARCNHLKSCGWEGSLRDL